MTSPAQRDPLLTLAQAASVLRCSSVQLWETIARGQLQLVYVARNAPRLRTSAIRSLTPEREHR